MIQCQICQVENEESAQFCRECGGRLQAPKPSIPAPAPAPLSPAPAAPASSAPAAPRPKLRSPLFGGGGGDDDGDADEPAEQPVLNKSKSKGLRSPLLRSDDDDDDAPEPKVNNSKSRGGGGLRSPMFGGGGDGGKNKDHKSTFPHRSHEFDEEEPRPAAKLEPGRHQSKGLRSPLLGGDDFDPEAGLAEDPGIQGKAAGQIRAHHRLRSPILGDVEDGYEDEIFDEEAEDVDDPTVLRSPLLAVRAPRQKTPLAQPSQASAAPEPPKPPAPITMQSPQSQMQQMQQMQQSPPQNEQPMPRSANYGYGQQPVPGGPAQGPPTAPTSAPSYEPRPAPSPSNSQYSMAAQSAQPNPAPLPGMSNPGQGPAHYDYGVQTANAAPTTVPTPMPTPVPSGPAPAPLAKADDSKKGMRGSKLLATGDTNNDDDEDLLVGPKDRRNKSRERRMPRTDRRAGALDIDDDDDVLPMAGRRGSAGASGGSPNAMAPLLMASAAVALICKIYIFLPQLSAPDLFTKYLPSAVEQISTMAVLVCLILFALKSSQKG